MKYTNILEKLICIVNIVKNNWIYLAFISLALFMLLLLAIKKISKKTCFIGTLIGYIALLTVLIINNSKELEPIGNSIVNHLFMNIYFPSIQAYLFIVLVMDIVIIVSLLSGKLKKVYVWLHGIFFFIIQFILTILLEILSKNQIDVFSKTSLFGNKDVIMLLELSINVFIAWIVTTVFAYFTNLITEKITLSKKNRKEETIPNMNTLESEIKIQEEVEQPVLAADNDNLPNENTVTVLPIENVVPVEAPSYVEQVNTNNEEEVTEPITNVSPIEEVIEPVAIEDPIFIPNPVPAVQEDSYLSNFDLNEFVPGKQPFFIPEPVIEETNTDNTLIVEPKVEVVEEPASHTDSYTLNDYRIFNQMLKDIKEHNQNNTVTIDKNLEYRLITKYSNEKYRMFKQMLKIYSH